MEEEDEEGGGEGEEEDEEEKINRNWSVLKTSPQLRKSKVLLYFTWLHSILSWTVWIV